jgi:1-acyl-sn-glycerol-3-phosphate acyltransferase
MIRTVVMLAFWGLAALVAALIGFPWTFISGDIRLLYRMFMWGCWWGVWPIQTPLIPRRTSVMAKKELFRIPILGRAMRMGSLVPVDRGNRDAGIEAVKAAKAVVQQGLNMTIYVEGKRSFDGKLLPFKKGPFYLAMECGVPVVPITIVGTFHAMPKSRFAIRPGPVQVIFHPPIEPRDFGTREALMEKVRAVIDSGLPKEFQSENVEARWEDSGRSHDAIG